MASKLFGHGKSDERDPSSAKSPGKSSGAGVPKDSSRALKQLQKLVVEKNVDALAAHYANYLISFPELTLEAGPQYDMARLLEQGGKAGLALLAYERLIKSAPEAPVTVNALFAAGKICATMSAQLEEAEQYLRRFLDTKPLLRDYQEASRIMEEVRERRSAEKSVQQKASREETPPIADISEQKPQPQGSAVESASQSRAVLAGDIDEFLQKEGSKIEYPKQEVWHPPRRADRTEIMTADERKELTRGKDFSPASQTKTAGPETKRPPATTAAPVSPVAVKPRKQPIDLSQSRFIAAIAAGKKVKFPTLVEIVSQHLQIDRTSAERRIILGKGILFRDLDLHSAALVYRIFEKSEQGIVIVRMTPKISFESEREVEHCVFRDRSIRFASLGEDVEIWKEEIILLCCGSVQLTAGAGSPKSVLDIFVRDPKLLLRIWENTFGFRGSNLDLPTFEEKNFLMLCKRFAAETPVAVRTGVFERMIEHDLLCPQIFDSLVEYDNYNYWHLLNAYGEKTEPQALLSAV
jgi:tetratricopeptide (TPR) repeat protein